ncbi:M23 family metallopeptidase [Lachnospiraceae bacterium OttesenSCG-928-D06]|nr:M23 family metallopeptidase [Lachnospiraceae bacterium OttesenSCG-928-D06]
MSFHKGESKYTKAVQKIILLQFLFVLVAAAVVVNQSKITRSNSICVEAELETDYIKWIDFTVSYEALCAAYDWDIDTYESDNHISWIDLLAYTAAKTGGKFDKNALKTLEKAAEAMMKGEENLEEITKDLEYYAYYKEAYEAILGGMVGTFEEEVMDENGNLSFQMKYGLKAYFPLAKGFEYTHYDDFGAGRSYGYDRKHLGHDLLGQTGTPIIAVESGYVEAIGWNQYGGWRIGIRSFDKKRYYYYAHMRQNYPYAENITEGSIVTAGDVIGYMGRTGYSTKENTNNIDVSHLHLGIEIILNEKNKEDNNEIWIDLYALSRFLTKHTQEAVKKEDTKEWIRTTNIKDPLVEEAIQMLE